MLIFLEQVLNGLTIGALYALVAAGLALTVGVLRVVNFCHGDLFMVGSYLFWFLFVHQDLTYPVASALTIPAMAAAGVVFQQTVIRPVVRRPWQVQLIATLAASTILNNAVIWLVGSTPQSTPTRLSRLTLRVLGFSLSAQRVLILLATVVIFATLQVFLKRTRLGMAMRAVSQNREAAEAAGIEVGAIALVTFAVGTALVGLGNVLVTPVYSVFPAMGMMLTLKAFAVMTVGGFGRVNGTVLAALLLGVVEALGTGYLDSAFTDAFAFVAMILVLLFAPYGLFGRKVGI
jgi:branched-chain amino acid transport system permease protein